MWKCLQWIIYFSLMATAIFFARDVIEKYFGQNTGIKQYMEKIDSHPTITICPFQGKCDGSMALTLTLQGELKETKNLAIYEGIYNIISSDLINNKPYWLHKHDRNKALWYNGDYGVWCFGPKGNYFDFDFLGNINDTVPYEATGWYYKSNSWDWIFTTTNVTVELGR